MKIFISVVSHEHKKIIEDMECLPELTKFFTVVLKSNKEEEGIKDYCLKNNIHLIDDNYGKGFGANNNIVFQYCVDNLNMSDSDYFVVFNPDCYVSVDSTKTLVESMKRNKHKLATINLYKSKTMDEYDNSLRRFPSFFSFVFSFLGLSSYSIIRKENIHNTTPVDWAHGSFLVFLVSHYHNLSGFDERYFMYCDDTDICLRSNLMNEPTYYYPNINGVHLKQASSKKILSKYFFFHIKSVCIFTFRRFFVL